MSDKIQKINEETLEKVSGGVSNLGKGAAARTITPIWVEVTADKLRCREYPDGPIIMLYNKGDRLLVDRISKDGLWYGMEIIRPDGGSGVGYVYKQYVRQVNEPGSNAVG